MKRALGVMLGVSLGLGLAVAASVVLRRVKPELADAVADEAREMVGRVRSALAEGREAARATEAELRGKVIDGGK